MRDYDKKKELSYIQYRDVNNLYGWINVVKASGKQFWVNEDFIKNYKEGRDEKYFLEVDV